MSKAEQDINRKLSSYKSKIIFIAYNHKDKVIARFIYQKLIKEGWFNIENFMDEFSIKPGKDIKTECIEKAKNADLGIVILSEYTQKSEYVSQEIGILLARDIPKIYVSIHENLVIPPGYEKDIKSFLLYEERNPFMGLSKIVELVKAYLDPEEIGPVELATRGTKLAAQGKFDEALECYEKAILRDPDYDIAYFSKILNLRRLGRYNEAIQFADKALAKFPNHTEILTKKAFVLYSIKKFEEAIKIYNKILFLDSNNINAMYYKAECLNKSGKFDKALKYFREVNEHNPDSKLGKRANRRIIVLKNKTSDK